MAKLAWITGAGGLIGSHIVREAPAGPTAWQLRALTRDELDLADFPATELAFVNDRPALVIHCAALSKSPICQSNPALAWRLNTEVTRHLTQLAADIPLLFFSTDLVFDGQDGNYNESASPRPLSVYAETKMAAETLVLANPRHLVIRTSLNGGPSPTGDRGFNEQLRLAWQKGERLRLFVDEFRSPIHAQFTARAVWDLVERECGGLFHFAGSERLSRWQIGQLVAARWPQLHPLIEPASLKDYQGAPRAPDTSLCCRKILPFLSFTPPGLTEWLESNLPAEF